MTDRKELIAKTEAALKECFETHTMVDVSSAYLKSVLAALSESQWISVNERLPEVNGKAVLGLKKINGSYWIIGAVRFTTELGDIYKDTSNEGEPVWELFQPYADMSFAPIEPNAITHWQPLPAPPDGK